MKVIVIGSGPCGLLSAISIKRHHPDYDVLILEKDSSIGSRIKISGNGRCNFINKELSVDKYSSSFVEPIIKYQNDVLDLLNETGFSYYFDEQGRGYPTSESSLTFINVLRDLLNKYNIEVKTKYLVNKIERKEKIIINGEISCDRLVLSIGGISYLNERLNYNRIVSELGLNITQLTPSLAPISVNHFPNELENKRVKSIAKLLYKNQVVKEERGEVIFKKDGLSGICIFNLSSYLARKHLKVYDDYQVSLDLLPDKNESEIIKLINLDSSLTHIFINELANYLNTFNDLVKTIKDLRFEIRGIYDFKNSQVTSGGVNLSQINSNLSLKTDNRIFLGGELIDIDGDCGGYNIGFALCSGYLIGKEIR